MPLRDACAVSVNKKGRIYGGCNWHEHRSFNRAVRELKNLFYMSMQIL